MNADRLPNLTTRDIRAVNGLTRKLARTADRKQFARTYIEGVDRMIPGEINVWDEASLDPANIVGFAAASPGGLAQLGRVLDAIVEHLPRHPVLRSVGWSGARKQPRRLSDFCSRRKFRENPLYREAYRKVGFDCQIAFSLGLVGDGFISLTLNRTGSDYSDRELEIFWLIATGVGKLLRLAQQRQVLERRIRAIEQAFRFAPATISELTTGELRLLGKIVARATNPERYPRVNDTERKSRYAVIEKLHLESNSQLLATLVRHRTQACEWKNS